MVQNIPQPTCWIDLARQWFCIIPLTWRFSTTITWFSLTILRDSLWRKSSLQLVIFLWTLATFFLAWFRLLEPFSFLDNCCCFIFKFFSCLFSIRGLSNLEPSLVIAKWVSPRSIPIALPLAINSGFCRLSYTLQGDNLSFCLKGIYGCENASYDLLKYKFLTRSQD